MPQISVRVTDKITLGLNDLRGRVINEVADEYIQELTEEARDELVGDHPRGSRGGYNIPTRPRQRYQRTGRLGRATQVYRTGRTWTIKSSARYRGRGYSGYVLGNADGFGQAAIHSMRWPTMRQVMTKMAEIIRLKSAGFAADLMRRSRMG